MGIVGLKSEPEEHFVGCAVEILVPNLRMRRLGKKCEAVGSRLPMMVLLEVDAELARESCSVGGIGSEEEGHGPALEGQIPLERPQNRRRYEQSWVGRSGSPADCGSSGGC